MFDGLPLMSTRTEPLKYVERFGPVWEEHPDWTPDQPWEDRWVYPEDKGYGTLGWQIIDWLHTEVGDPNGNGKLRLTPEQQRWFLWWYAYDKETEEPVFRQATLARLKGWGKDPLAAALCIVEFVGPCRPGGYDAEGNLVARPHSNPLVQLAAVTKEQNSNTGSLLPVMMDQAFQDKYQVNPGVEVSYAFKRRNTLKLLTSNFRTQEGARPSCVVENEPHHWLASQGGVDFHNVLGRNLAKRGFADPWARRVLITNAYKPSEESVARIVREAYEDRLAGRAVDAAKMMYDSIEVRSDVPIIPMTTNENGDRVPVSDEEVLAHLIDVLNEVRGDSYWLNSENYAAEILNNENPLSESRRFYFNQITATDEAWLDPADVKAAILEEVQNHRAEHGVKDTDMEPGWMQVRPSEPVAIFFDASKSNDMTGLVGCRISDGYCFTLGYWGRPSDLPNNQPYRVPREMVDSQVKRVMRRFNVVAFWGDPSHAKDDEDYSPYWDTLFDAWHDRYSDQLLLWAVKSSGVSGAGHSIMWDMTSPARTAQFVEAAQRTVAEFEAQEIKIDGHPVLVQHLLNAQEREDPKNGVTLGKESRHSKKKIDLAVCLVGARMLRRFVVVSGILDDAERGDIW